MLLLIENSYNRKQRKNGFATLINQEGQSYDFEQSTGNSLHCALFSLCGSWSSYWRILENMNDVAFGLVCLVQAFLKELSTLNLSAKYNILLWCNSWKYRLFSFYWKWYEVEQCFYEGIKWMRRCLLINYFFLPTCHIVNSCIYLRIIDGDYETERDVICLWPCK